MKGKAFRGWVLGLLELKMLRSQEIRWHELADHSKSYKHPGPFHGAEGIPRPLPPPSVPPAISSPTTISEEAPPRRASTSSTNGGCTGRVLAGRGETSRCCSLTGGKYSRESSGEPSRPPPPLGICLPKPLPFPTHADHLPERPEVTT